jgi:hypothetical protein
MSEPEDTPVASGDRRDDIHYEPDADQLVRARFTAKPEALTLEQEQNLATDRGDIELSAPPLEDVAVTPSGPSVWDARPATKDEDGQHGDA